MSKSKAKGTRVENLIRDMHLKEGVDAERVPMSGSLGGKYSGDVIVGSIENPILRCEVKARKGGKGFAVIEGWLEGNDVIFLKRDRVTPFVAMTWEKYIMLLKGYLK